MAEARTCIYCHQTYDDHDLRPYGPNGAWVCFDCAMSTPERKIQAEAALDAAFDAAESTGASVILLGNEAGPIPVGGKRQ